MEKVKQTEQVSWNQHDVFSKSMYHIVGTEKKGTHVSLVVEHLTP